jgi:hypothetical protein
MGYPWNLPFSRNSYQLSLTKTGREFSSCSELFHVIPSDLNEWQFFYSSSNNLFESKITKSACVNLENCTLWHFFILWE